MVIRASRNVNSSPSGDILCDSHTARAGDHEVLCNYNFITPLERSHFVAFVEFCLTTPTRESVAERIDPRLNACTLIDARTPPQVAGAIV